MNRNWRLVLLGIWIFIVIWWLALPPDSPEPFPEHQNALIPPRGIYDPTLGAAFNQDLRDYWQKPDQILQALGDLEGLEVADIGCGEGYFTLRLLELVGPNGKVYATDIQKEVLDTLTARIPSVLAARARPILSTGDDVGLPNPVDLIFLVQVLGEIPHQKDFMAKLLPLLKPQGRLVLIDSRHVTDPENGHTRPLNQVRLLEQLDEIGFDLAPGYQAGTEFLPKQFFYVLVPKRQALERLSRPEGA